MSLYVMADLHLSSDGAKSMEIFGPRWTDYMNKIRRNWSAVITDEDTVIVPGDVSWALKLEDARDDLRFLDSLPGKKLLGKGNHDFWWETAAKLHRFFEQNDITADNPDIKITYYRCPDNKFVAIVGNTTAKNVKGKIDLSKLKKGNFAVTEETSECEWITSEGKSP